MKPKTTRNLYLCLLTFLGIGAIGGGGVLIISPGGQLMGIPLSSLANTPFNNFLIPGIILFTVLGLIPCFLVIALIKKTTSALAERMNFFNDMLWSWTFSIYIAFALIIWIQVEMIYFQAVYWLHTFYMFFAIAMIFVGLLPQVRSLYRK